MWWCENIICPSMFDMENEDMPFSKYSSVSTACENNTYHCLCYILQTQLWAHLVCSARKMQIVEINLLSNAVDCWFLTYFLAYYHCVYDLCENGSRCARLGKWRLEGSFWGLVLSFYPYTGSGIKLRSYETEPCYWPWVINNYIQ